MRMREMSADSLISTCNLGILSKFTIIRKIMTDYLLLLKMRRRKRKMMRKCFSRLRDKVGEG
jgi:hypothetical protein